MQQKEEARARKAHRKATSEEKYMPEEDIHHYIHLQVVQGNQNTDDTDDNTYSTELAECSE